MRRTMNLSEETDGKLYKADDEVLLSCDSCSGGADCCRNTADTIILDPYDFYNLQKATGTDFAGGYKSFFDLRVVDGLTLPYLLKSEESESCVFLQNGRCGIHAYRPGFCRLFPLGRLYSKTGFDYILQTGQCPCKPEKTVTVRDWLGIEDLEKYEEYVQGWHEITEKKSEAALKLAASENRNDSIISKRLLTLSMSVLQVFYAPAYNTAEDFYTQFAMRVKALES